MAGPSIDVSDFVSVVVNVSPLAVPYELFGLPLVIGDSPVIDVNQRIREYTSIEGVGGDFSDMDPEYLAAEDFFAQTPQPSLIAIGRWASAATPGLLHGATLSAEEQILQNFTAITSGSFFIAIDGVPYAISGLSFASALNLNGVAQLIQNGLDTALAASVTATASGSWSITTPNITLGAANKGQILPGMTVYDATTQETVGHVLTCVGTALVLTADAAYASQGAADSLVFSVPLCVWNAEYSRFDILSSTVGPNSSVSFGRSPTAVGNYAFAGQPATGTKASQTFTESTTKAFLATDTITIGNQTFTFVATLGSAPGNILVPVGGSTNANFVLEMGYVIAAMAASISGSGATTNYIPNTTPSNVSGAVGNGLSSGATYVFTDLVVGSAGNSLVSTYTDNGGTSAGSFGAGTFANGVNADSIDIASTVVSFIPNGQVPVGNQSNLGSTLAGTLANLLTFLQSSSDSNLVKCTYVNDGVGHIYLVAASPGVGGDSITTTASSTNIAASGATLVGVTGTDISTLLGLTLASGASPIVIGLAAESPLAAVQAAANVSTQWYGVTFASTAQPQNSDYESVASYILASSRSRLFALTIQNPACLDPTQTEDLASVLQSFNNKRVIWQYSSSDPYAVMSLLGREFTVNFNGNLTTITTAYKQEPGVQGENLNQTQFATVVGKGGNVLINVNNGAVMVWPGQMSNGYWFDEVHNVDWFQNRTQTDLFNLLYETTTKVPQTDAGDNTMANTIEGSCAAAVYNGMAAPGQWNAAGFGALSTGDQLSKGFYVYFPPIATQSESDRTERISVPFQVALKLAGAVHIADVIVNINR